MSWLKRIPKTPSPAQDVKFEFVTESFPLDEWKWAELRAEGENPHVTIQRGITPNKLPTYALYLEGVSRKAAEKLIDQLWPNDAKADAKSKIDRNNGRMHLWNVHDLNQVPSMVVQEQLYD